MSGPGTACPGGGPSKLVQIQADAATIEVWSGNERLAVHPRAQRSGQQLTVPGQWVGLAAGEGRPPREPLAIQLASVEVEQRSLTAYAALVGGAS